LICSASCTDGDQITSISLTRQPVQTFTLADMQGTWSGTAFNDKEGSLTMTISFGASGNVTGGINSLGGIFTGGTLVINSATGALSGTLLEQVQGQSVSCTLDSGSQLNAAKTLFTGSASCTSGARLSAISLTSEQAKRTLTVKIVGLEDGTVIGLGIKCGTDCQEIFNSGTSVTLTANTSSSDSAFGGWSGACTGTGTCRVTMSADRSVTATFFRKFTDESLTSKVTFVKASHFLKALTAINTLRQLNGLGTISFSAPIPAVGVPISAKDMITLQTGLNAIYDALGRTRPTFDSIVPRVTVVGKRQMDQVRNAIRALESILAN